MTQEEARIIVKEALKESRDEKKAKLKKISFAEGVILAASVGSVAIANAMGVDPATIHTITNTAMIINGSSAVGFVSLFSPLFYSYSLNKNAVEKLESEPTPDPNVDYVEMVEKYGFSEHGKSK